MSEIYFGNSFERFLYPLNYGGLYIYLYLLRRGCASDCTLYFNIHKTICQAIARIGDENLLISSNICLICLYVMI